MKKEKLTYEPDEVQSRASLLALNKQYFNNPDVDTDEPYKVWLNFRMRLLTRWEEERGTLTCYFCGQDNLYKVIDNVEPKYQATLDHYFPLAHGGLRYSEDNLVVACRKCNQKKADTLPEVINESN